MKYGNNHAALQVGPYLIHWFNDSIVHINVVSLKKALLLIYPRYDTADCFTNRADVLAGSSLESTYFGKVSAGASTKVLINTCYIDRDKVCRMELKENVQRASR